MKKKLALRQILKYIGTAVALVAIAVFCTFILNKIWGNTDESEDSKDFQGKYSLTEEHFGTIMTITLYGENEEDLKNTIKGAYGEIERLEKIFSAKFKNSELSMLNKKAASEPVKVSDELMQLMKEALYYGEMSQGALDVSIGGLIKLWGIGTENERVPEDNELSVYVGKCRYKDIIIDENDSTIYYGDENIDVDLGAIAKGYAADIVKEYINNRMDNACGILDFGGNIMTIGSKTDGSSWNIGITDPFSPDRVAAVLSVKDKCVVTSGNYERYFEKDGKRYHHILNPYTGYPADEGIVSATIIGNNSMECDALSTACYILGVDKALELIDGMEGVEAVFIDKTGKFYTTGNISKYGFVQN